MSASGLCICGQGKNLDELCIQCAECKRWCHARCLPHLKLEGVPKFIRNYRFICASCSKDGTDQFDRTMAGWIDVCVTSLANLYYDSQKSGECRLRFDGKREVCEFMDKNWDTLCTGRARTATWWATVNTCMYTHNKIFKQCKIPVGDETRIVYEFMDKDISSHVFPSQTRAFLGTTGCTPPPKETLTELIITTKRRKPESAEEARRRIRERLMLEVVDQPKKPKKKKEHKNAGLDEEPFNCFGMRWKPVINQAKGVTLSPCDRAPQVILNKSRMSVTGDKGYATVRATHGVDKGKWYFEFSMQRNTDGSARVGWSRSRGQLQAPVGIDEYGFGYRGTGTGTVYHMKKGVEQEYSYDDGDIVGAYICLGEAAYPRKQKPLAWESACDPTQPSLNYVAKRADGEQVVEVATQKRHGKRLVEGPASPRSLALRTNRQILSWGEVEYYLEDDEEDTEAEIPGSFIQFSVNGQKQAVPYQNIPAGVYYPAASVFQGAKVTFNFGPKFEHPPGDGYRGIHELHADMVKRGEYNHDPSMIRIKSSGMHNPMDARYDHYNDDDDGNDAIDDDEEQGRPEPKKSKMASSPLSDSSNEDDEDDEDVDSELGDSGEELDGGDDDDDDYMPALHRRAAKRRSSHFEN